MESFYFSFSNGPFEMYKEEVLFDLKTMSLSQNTWNPQQITADRDGI